MHHTGRKPRTKQVVLGASVALGLALAALPVAAQNAGDVLERMNAEQQASYVAGVIEGLAFSRYLQEQPDTAGMQCVYDWYHNGQAEKWALIEQWFGRHPDRPVGAMLHILIGRDCGS